MTTQKFYYQQNKNPKDPHNQTIIIKKPTCYMSI